MTYHHLLLEQHEILTADGVLSESFHPGQWGVSLLDAPTRAEVLTLFPELDGISKGEAPLAWPPLRRREAGVLMAALSAR